MCNMILPAQYIDRDNKMSNIQQCLQASQLLLPVAALSDLTLLEKISLIADLKLRRLGLLRESV